MKIAMGEGIACRKVLRERRGIVPACSASESELTRFSDGSGKYLGSGAVDISVRKVVGMYTSPPPWVLHKGSF